MTVKFGYKLTLTAAFLCGAALLFIYVSSRPVSLTKEWAVFPAIVIAALVIGLVSAVGCTLLKHFVGKNFSNNAAMRLSASEFLFSRQRGVFIRGIEEFYDRKIGKAALSFLKCARKSKDNDEKAACFVWLAKCSITKGNFSAASKNFGFALEYSPHNEDALHGLGFMHFIDDKYEDAEVYYKRAVEHNANDKEAYFMLGEIYFKQNRFEKALKELKTACKTDSFYIPALAQMSAISAKIGNTAESNLYFRKAVYAGMESDEIGELEKSLTKTTLCNC